MDKAHNRGVDSCSCKLSKPSVKRPEEMWADVGGISLCLLEADSKGIKRGMPSGPVISV